MKLPVDFIAKIKGQLSSCASAICSMTDHKPSSPKFGIVVTTHGSVPYVHLHLEARERFYPAEPMLIHDDGSDDADRIAALCHKYGVDFENTGICSGHSRGDILAILGGLAWAKTRKLNILVKFSRRFLPLEDWTADLRELVKNADYATYSSWTESHGFGFRTECLAMDVDRWLGLGLFDALYSNYLCPQHPYVEMIIHGLAQKAAIYNSETALAYDRQTMSRKAGADSYAIWDFMGYDRDTPSPRFLWHDSCSPEIYYKTGTRWGLTYNAGDYVV